jgi:hypothetical protein
LQPLVRCCGVAQVGWKPLDAVETGAIVESALKMAPRLVVRTVC